MSIPPPPPPPIFTTKIETNNGNGKLLADIRKGIKLKQSNVLKENNNISFKNDNQGTMPLDLNNNDNDNGVGTLTKKNPKMALVQNELTQTLKKRSENIDDQPTTVPNQILSPSLALFVQNKTKPLQRLKSSDDSKVAGQMIGHGGRNFVISTRKFDKNRPVSPKGIINSTQPYTKQETVYLNGTNTLAKQEKLIENDVSEKHEVVVVKKMRTPQKQEILVNIVQAPIKHEVVIFNKVPPMHKAVAVHKLQAPIKNDIIVTNKSQETPKNYVCNDIDNIETENNKEKDHIASEHDDCNLVAEASRLCRGLVNTPIETNTKQTSKIEKQKSIHLVNAPVTNGNFKAVVNQQKSISPTFDINENDLPIEVIEQTICVEEIKKNFYQNNENGYDKKETKVKTYGVNENVYRIKHQMSVNTEEREVSPDSPRQKSPVNSLPLNSDYVQVGNTMSLRRPKAAPPTNLKISHGKPNFVTRKSPPRDNVKSPPMIHLTEINIPPQSYPDDEIITKTQTNEQQEQNCKRQVCISFSKDLTNGQNRYPDAVNVIRPTNQNHTNYNNGVNELDKISLQDLIVDEMKLNDIKFVIDSEHNDIIIDLKLSGKIDKQF